jgi:ATP-dependent Lon protease
LEEELYPRYYTQVAHDGIARDSIVSDVVHEPVHDPVVDQAQDELAPEMISPPPSVTMGSHNGAGEGRKEQHLTFQENQQGVTYDALFGPYLVGARRIIITDPYIRHFYQIRNLMELLETVARLKPDDEEVAVHLVTVKDAYKSDQQIESLAQIQTAGAAIGIRFIWSFDESNSLHARHIVTNDGWKILLDRGLDIFQSYEMKDTFAFANRMQQYRKCKAFEVTFLRVNDT